MRHIGLALALLMVLAQAFAFSASAVSSGLTEYANPLVEPYQEIIDGIASDPFVLHVRAAAIGIDSKLKAAASQTLDFFWNEVERSGAFDGQACIEKATSHLNFLQKNEPGLHSHYLHLADAIDVPVVELIAYYDFKSLIFREECTTFGATANATYDGTPFVCKNWDEPYYYRAAELAMMHTPIHSQFTGEEGFDWYQLDNAGMNEKGLCFVTSALPTNDTGEGLGTQDFINLFMPKMELAKEAVKLFLEKPRGGSHNLVIGDRFGNVAAIEYTAKGVGVTFLNQPEEKLYEWEENGSVFRLNYTKNAAAGRANHGTLLKDRCDDPTPDIYPSSHFRNSRMNELLVQYGGKIDWPTASAIMSDHGNGMEIPGIGLIGGFHCICRHSYDEPMCEMYGQNAFVSYPGPGGTCNSFIMQPALRTISWAPGHPCRVPYFNITMTDDAPSNATEEDAAIQSGEELAGVAAPAEDGWWKLSGVGTAEILIATVALAFVIGRLSRKR